MDGNSWIKVTTDLEYKNAKGVVKERKDVPILLLPMANVEVIPHEDNPDRVYYKNIFGLKELNISFDAFAAEVI